MAGQSKFSGAGRQRKIQRPKAPPAAPHNNKSPLPPIHPREIYAKSEKSMLRASQAIAAGVLSRHTVTNVDNQALAKAKPVTFAVTNRLLTRHTDCLACILQIYSKIGSGRVPGRLTRAGAAVGAPARCMKTEADKFVSLVILLKNPPVFKNHQLNLKLSQVEIIPASVVGDLLSVTGPFWWCFQLFLFNHRRFFSRIKATV